MITGDLGTYIAKLAAGTPINVAKYVDPTRMTVAVASEVGLPILAHVRLLMIFTYHHIFNLDLIK